KFKKNKKLKIIVPAHKPIKKSTLSHILKQAELTTEELLRVL
ncbi:MAG TPA: addiction module toxin, HicA family, partial [Planctomycetaceae bacterium]|nr:addiction module toxin, HicA family [Planctomycetaceae bacterium]